MNRCPHCGGLVSETAEWCGQCLQRLDADPSPPGEGPVRRPGAGTASTPPGSGGVRAEGDRVVWRCPTCGTDNPIEAPVCRACSAPFERLLDEPDSSGPRTSPARAVRLSLAFPGAGHLAVGRGAEGVARAVTFVYVAGTAAAILLVGSPGGGPFLPLLLLSVAAAVALYAVTAVDAGRAARGLPPVLSSRALLYGTAGMILATLAVVLIAGMRAAGS